MGVYLTLVFVFGRVLAYAYLLKDNCHLQPSVPPHDPRPLSRARRLFCVTSVDPSLVVTLWVVG